MQGLEVWSSQVLRRQMRRDFVSPTLSKPQSLGLFPTSVYCDTFISKFLPYARILKMGFPTVSHSSVYINYQWDAYVPVRVAPSWLAALYFCCIRGIRASPWNVACAPICTTQWHSLRPHCLTKAVQEFGSSSLLFWAPSVPPLPFPSLREWALDWGWGWGASPLVFFLETF